MRIHRIRLENYRGVERCEVVFAEDGVTIVEGQNEVGKTSLLEAVNLVIDYPDSSGAGAVKAVRRVDQDEGAEAEIEVSTGPYRFTYRKRWHRDRLTELMVVTPEREQLTGRDAHDRVDAILDETLDKTLWAALRLEQGGELSQAAFGAGVSLGRALDQAAGGDAGGGMVEDDLWSRVQEERARYWTATGQPKGDRSALETKVTAARSKVDELEAELHGLDADAEAVARLVEHAASLEQRAQDSKQDEEQLKDRVEAIARCRNDVRKLELGHDAEVARHELCADAATRRRRLVEKVDGLRSAAASAGQELERAGPARQAAEARVAQVHDALEQARQVLADAEAAHRQAGDDEAFRRQQIELAQLSERHERIVTAQERLTEAEAVLDSALVDDDLIARIDAANLDVVRAKAAAKSGAVNVAATALADVDLQIDGSSQRLADGETTETVVTDAAEIIVADLVRLEVRAGSEAQDLADRVTEAEATLTGLCAPAGVSGVDEARTVHRARNDALLTTEEASATIKRDLRDLTLESLAQKVARLTERTGGFEAERPPDPPLPIDFEAAKTTTADREVAASEARSEVERLDQDGRTAATALSDAQVGNATLAETARQTRAAQLGADEELLAARSHKSDEALSDDNDAAKARADDVARRLADARDALEAQDPDSVDALLENAAAIRRRTADELRNNLEETQRLRTRLEIKGEEGLGLDLDEAKTALDHLQRDFERIQARAEAVELLYDVMTDHRDRARSRYVAPFKDGIEQLGRIVFGGSLEVELDDDLRIARRTLDDVTVDFDQLSTGAQEQLGLIGRLACARIVSADGGVPVVFDDALGWTDPTRLDLMGAAIALAGRECQIIILTCTPDRYANVGNASVVQLAT